MNRFDQRGKALDALQKIRDEKRVAIQNGWYEERSTLEFKDAHKTNSEYLKSEQNKILANK